MKVNGILTKEWGCNSNGRSLSRSNAKLLQLDTVGTSSNVSSTKKNNLILPHVIVSRFSLRRTESCRITVDLYYSVDFRMKFNCFKT